MADSPSFDLIIATVDRIEPLDRLLASLEQQRHRSFRVIVVDQNNDERLTPILATHDRLELARLRSPRGLSRARNAALPHVEADIVAFPDDDCEYTEDILERVAEELVRQPELGGLSGRTAGVDGVSAGRWSKAPGMVNRDTVWHCVNSAALFLRGEVVAQTGGFDERLGLGSSERWASGEEVDYLVRAIDGGARIAYDPSVVVRHSQSSREGRELARIGHRDGASVGYLLRKHRYGPRAVGRALVRPLGGIVVATARLDVPAARFHAATLCGRVEGYIRATS